MNKLVKNWTILVAVALLHLIPLQRDFLLYTEIVAVFYLVEIGLKSRKKRRWLKSDFSISLLINIPIVACIFLLGKDQAIKAVVLFQLMLASDFIVYRVQGSNRTDKTTFLDIVYYLQLLYFFALFANLEFFPFNDALSFTSTELLIINAVATTVMALHAWLMFQQVFALISERQARLNLELETEWMRDFFGLINHHIRSPLAAANLRIEMLRMRAGGKSELTISESELEQLEGAQNQVLSIADQFLSAWKVDRTYNLLALSKLIEQKIHTYGFKSFLARETIMLTKIEQLTLNVALDSFIDNAIKYGGKNISVLPTGRAEFIVKDDGPGMTPEQLERFGKQESRYSRTGAGVGAVLTGKMLKHIGWAMVAENGNDGGTVIRVYKEAP